MAENNKRAAEGEAAGTGENLEKVRDILFGSQMREADKRFAKLDEKLERGVSDLRDETRKRLDSLEAYIKKEIQSLLERVKSESGQRTEAVRGIAQELKETTKELESRITEHEEHSAEAHRGLRQEILDQSTTLRDEIHHGGQELTTAMNQSVDEVRSEKADRSALADLFTEMAMRLSSDENAGA